MSLKRDNFIRLAEARTTRAIKSIRVIGNLSNRSNYEYTEDDIKKIVAVLNAEIVELRSRFKVRGSSDGFRLRS